MENSVGNRNERVKLSPGDHALRLYTIGIWIVAFPFLLAHGIVSTMMCPVLGIIPMTFSACYGFVQVYGLARSRKGNIAMDLFLSLFLIGILIPSWVLMADGNCGWRWRCSSEGVVMVGTYGTMPMMASFCVHSYFVLREISFKFPSKKCPHCNGELHPARTPRVQRSLYKQARRDESPAESETKEYYQPIHLADAEMEQGAADAKGIASSSSTPRASMDETTRLV